MGTANNTLMGSPRKWAQHGKSGIWVSELYPNIAKHADKLCVVRSMHTNGQDHGQGDTRQDRLQSQHLKNPRPAPP